MPPKRVLCIMDQAVVGRASLAVAGAVLSACGVQACPLPSALYSSHTGGFGPVETEDLAAFGRRALAHYTREGIVFDAVYTGYLANEAQAGLALEAMALYPGALHVVDPALGDHGRLYTGIGPQLVEAMRLLCRQAHLATPNFTEAALLLGRDPAPQPDSEKILREFYTHFLQGDLMRDNIDDTIEKIENNIQKKNELVITSAPAGGAAAAEPGAEAAEVIGLGAEGPWRLPVSLIGPGYPGTGDLFTAALTGLVLQGSAVRAAAARAAAFVGEAAWRTFTGGGEPRQGLWFEQSLGLLAPE